MSFAELAERVSDLMADGLWRRKTEIMQALGEPRPSDAHLRNVLNTLVGQGKLQRDPAEEKRGAVYRYRVPVPLLATKGVYGSRKGADASNTSPGDLFTSDDPFADMRGRCMRCREREAVVGSLYCASCAQEVSP